MAQRVWDLVQVHSDRVRQNRGLNPGIQDVESKVLATMSSFLSCEVVGFLDIFIQKVACVVEGRFSLGTGILIFSAVTLPLWFLGWVGAHLTWSAGVIIVQVWLLSIREWQKTMGILYLRSPVISSLLLPRTRSHPCSSECFLSSAISRRLVFYFQINRCDPPQNRIKEKNYRIIPTDAEKALTNFSSHF